MGRYNPARDVFLVALLIIVTALPVHASILQGNVIVQPQTTASDQLALDIQRSDNQPITRVTAHINGTEVSVSKPDIQPNTDQSTVILFLVDTSDPARQPAVDRAKQHIKQILDYRGDSIRYGLARFDTELTMLAPIGSQPGNVLARSQQLKATGRTTELYRNALSSIRLLARFPADRKFIFLLSDGKAEDQAYFHRDVVKAAIDTNIRFYSVGYAENITLTVALQTLRRLSEETGGRYIASNPGDYRIKSADLKAILDTLENSERYDVDLKPAIDAELQGRQALTLTVSSGIEHETLNIPVHLPVKPAPLATSEIIAPVEQANSQPVIIERVIEKEPAIGNNQHIYWIGISLLLVGLLIFMALRLRDSRQPAPVTPVTVSPVPEEPAAPAGSAAYAWLERLDNVGEDKKFAIKSGLTRIGRYRDNDIAIEDPAISRFHAELHFTEDNEFIITDMGSKNGLLVNDTETTEAQLHNNDVIELGDIRLRFVVQSEISDDMKNTVLFRTQVPPPSMSH